MTCTTLTPSCTVAPMTPDLHVVIFQRRIGDETLTSIVGGPETWHVAIDVWTKLDERRRQTAAQTTRKLDGFYAVRSINDPTVQPLLAQCSFHKSLELAARAWGKDNGLKGNHGGWIYGLGGGGPYQGWWAVGRTLERQRHIGLARHPRTGKATWINYGAPLVRALAESRV